MWKDVNTESEKKQKSLSEMKYSNIQCMAYKMQTARGALHQI